ncbi:MAG: DNA translocase FtsK 4TM domain-containing protein [Betaproteobacteria bacterium]|nr:DNA translocase FtsK 4TM domain-containing protein [Betaproteobacteria bacterium]
MRESWWLLVVAAFLWLALILATYTKADPGWSFRAAVGRSPIAAAPSAPGSPTCCSTCSAFPRGGGSPPASCWSSPGIGALAGPTSPPSTRSGWRCWGSRWCCCAAPESRRCGCTGFQRRCRSPRAARSAT